MLSFVEDVAMHLKTDLAGEHPGTYPELALTNPGAIILPDFKNSYRGYIFLDMTRAVAVYDYHSLVMDVMGSDETLIKDIAETIVSQAIYVLDSQNVIKVLNGEFAQFFEN